MAHSSVPRKKTGRPLMTKREPSDRNSRNPKSTERVSDSLSEASVKSNSYTFGLNSSHKRASFPRSRIISTTFSPGEISNFHLLLFPFPFPFLLRTFAENSTLRNSESWLFTTAFIVRLLFSTLGKAATSSNSIFPVALSDISPTIPFQLDWV